MRAACASNRHLCRSLCYSVVRNPLYLFTGIGAVGVGRNRAASPTCSYLERYRCRSSTFVLEEKRFLAAAFPDAFAAYAARVPRFWPRLSVWDDAGELLVKPRLVHRTFLDASLFLLAVPITDLIDWGQHLGWLPVLVYLP